MAGSQPGPQAWLTIHSMRCLWRLLSGGDMGFAESYVAGEWSSPHIGAVLDLGLRNSAAEARVRRLRTPDLLRRAAPCPEPQYAVGQPAQHRGPLRSRQRVLCALARRRHELFVCIVQRDRTRRSRRRRRPSSIGCANCWRSPAGENVLEIGCGWGGLAERMIAARLRGHRNDAVARAARITRAAGSIGAALGRHADLRLQDYRDVQGRYRPHRLDRDAGGGRRAPTGRPISANCLPICAPAGPPYCRRSPSTRLPSRNTGAGRISFKNIFFPAACCRRGRLSNGRPQRPG